MNIVLLGPPGSGKGTQGDILAEAMNIRKLSTGDLVRQAIAEESDIGLRMQTYMKEGDLVPDVLITELLENALSAQDWKKGFILDGFPRTLEQAKLLDAMFKANHQHIHLAIEFQLDPEHVLNRIKHRVQCDTCKAIYNTMTHPPAEEGVCDTCGEGQLIGRADDDPKIILHRIEVYQDEIKDVIDYYKYQSKINYMEVNANLELSNITSNIKKQIEQIEDTISDRHHPDPKQEHPIKNKI